MTVVLNLRYHILN